MGLGFFAEGTLQRSRAQTTKLPQCGACGIYKQCESPKMPVAGHGRAGVLVVGEAPGAVEDSRGVPFVGKSGQALRAVLRELGTDLDLDCWNTNALICRPPENDTPTDDQITYCRPNLLRVVKELQPRVVVLLGGAAVRSLVGHLWKSAPGAISRWVGWCIPSVELNAWVCPTYHPSYVIREQRAVLDLLFKNHLRAAIQRVERPWDVPPDYPAQVRVELDADKAAAVLRKMVERGGVASFDYETNMLKPHGPGARIVSCAVCWRGEQTMAYPFYGAAVEATRELLRSDMPKIAANLKFEETWSRVHVRTRVRNWLWDTMQAAHVLDNRSDITSVKFQAFVKLGMGCYDSHVKPYLEADGGNVCNRIDQIALHDLLLYNGLDALLEYKLAEIQMRELGYEFG